MTAPGEPRRSTPLLGALALVLAAVPPIAFLAGVFSADDGLFVGAFLLSLAATAGGILTVVVLRRRRARGWAGSAIALLLLAGIPGYLAWGWVLLLDVALRSGSIAP